MALRIDLTFDCAHPARPAAFWKPALGYEDEPPPAPFRTRQEWTEKYGDPGDTAERLVEAGATVVQEYPGHHITMADPEGNEFCLAKVLT